MPSDGRAGEFIELMHALDSEGTEETPLRIELGDNNRLTLPRKPKKRQVSSFPEGPALSQLWRLLLAQPS